MYWLLIAMGIVFMGDALYQLRDKDGVSWDVLGCDMAMALIAAFLAGVAVGIALRFLI